MTAQKTEFMGSQESKIRRDWMWMDRFYRERLERGEVPSLSIHHQPTDWGKTPKNEDPAYGWDESMGTCEKCFMLRSKSGACGC